MIKKILKFVFGTIFLFFAVFFLSAVYSVVSNGDSTTAPNASTTAQQKQVTYYVADAATMIQELQNNAAATSKRYKGQYLKVSGVLNVIDSDMRYISIAPNQYSIQGIHCTLKRNDKAQENYVMSLSKGQWVTAYGKITDVGEILGFTMDVDKFE